MPILQPTCPICGSPSRQSLPVVHAWNGDTWRLVRCRTCTHRYMDPMPDDAELTRMYDRSYFDEGGAWVCGFWSGSYEANERHLRQEARLALRALPRRAGRLLEIGCAGGFFMDEARRAGFEVTGCELNHEMVTFGRERLRLTIHQGLFEQQGFAPGSFDVIVMQDVLEHTRNPAVVVQQLAALLAPDGVFFLRGPMEEETRERFYHTLRRLARRGDEILAMPPFHLQGFTRASYTRLCGEAGLPLDTFTAQVERPPASFTSPKAIVASVIEWAFVAYDRARGGGTFMTAVARQTTPAIRDMPSAREATYPAAAHASAMQSS